MAYAKCLRLDVGFDGIKNMPGIKPREKVNRQWSPKLAYAVGLLATDGNLSPDGRHLNFTSKDFELIESFKHCLGIENKIGKKAREASKAKRYFYVQFGDVVFYRFLLTLGLTPAKSKTIGKLDIPAEYFFDFLRGSFDGDGTFFSYWDPRWRSSFMFYTVFISASINHLNWIREEIHKRLDVLGHITHDGRRITYHLKYAKKDSLKILKRMYYNPDIIYLKRKYLKIEKALSTIGLTL